MTWHITRYLVGSLNIFQVSSVLKDAALIDAAYKNPKFSKNKDGFEKAVIAGVNCVYIGLDRRLEKSIDDLTIVYGRLLCCTCQFARVVHLYSIRHIV